MRLRGCSLASVDVELIGIDEVLEQRGSAVATSLCSGDWVYTTNTTDLDPGDRHRLHRQKSPDHRIPGGRTVGKAQAFMGQREKTV